MTWTGTDIPESPYEPLEGPDRRHEPQAATDKAEEGLDLLIQFGIFSSSHLGAVFAHALLAEERFGEGLEAAIEFAKLLEALGAYCVKSLVALGRSNSRLEDQGLGMGGLLRLDIQGSLGVGGDLR
ncbi:hypothetical protein Ct61P_05949 [Colletotrichum tofieldiae]|nr:hypothetical protein Ct61P_05949 [Colletotrichum tofieldiae]